MKNKHAKIIFLIALVFVLNLSFSTIAKAEAERYHFDKDHTTILFFINHLGFSDKIGQFRDFDGYFTFDEDQPETGQVEVVIKPTSIDTGVKILDEELQKKDWFNSTQYPEINFKSTSINVEKDKTATIKGLVTMRGITKRAELIVKFNKAGTNHITGKYQAGFSADMKIKRSLFGMIIDIPFVGDEVKIHIETEGVREEAAK